MSMDVKMSGTEQMNAEAKFQYMTEMTILTVKLTVDFSKRLPGFDTILRDDQITLLKACSSEVMMLRCARRYDVKTDSIIFANDQRHDRQSLSMAGIGHTADSIFNFGKLLSAMKVDDAEYALLTAIDIFSGEIFFYSFSLVSCPSNCEHYSLRTTGTSGSAKGGKDSRNLLANAAGLRDWSSKANGRQPCQAPIRSN